MPGIKLAAAAILAFVFLPLSQVRADERVTLNLAAQCDQEETLVQRAMRIRVGQQLAREFVYGVPRDDYSCKSNANSSS